MQNLKNDQKLGKNLFKKTAKKDKKKILVNLT